MMKRPQRIPRFSVLRVLLAGLLIHVFLNLVIAGFSFFKQYPLMVIQQEPERFKQLVLTAQKMSKEELKETLNMHGKASTHDFWKRRDRSLDDKKLQELRARKKELHESIQSLFDPQMGPNALLIRTMDKITGLLGLVCLAFIIWYHLPLYRLFRQMRQDLDVPEDLRETCKVRLLRSPLLTALLPTLLVTLSTVAAWISAFFFKSSIYAQIMNFTAPLMFLSVILAALFMFLWQKRRVQTIFLHHVFTAKELLNKPPQFRDMKIQSKLMLLGMVTTILPLTLVFLFMLTSISFIPRPAELNDAQIAVLLGDYLKIVEKLGLGPMFLSWLKTEGLRKLPGLLHFNAINTPIMLIGLTLGILNALAYNAFMGRLTTADIVGPLTELRKKMQATASGEYHHHVIVRNNDEIGDLAQGFNMMLAGLEERERVKGLFGQYLTREVSEQILNGRVNLGGDLFEATIMFADIRNFTAMSEDMSPTEVLQFLNSYLERMIDVIAETGGIIDKFLGDGILAVFGAPVRNDSHAEQALRAALSMQRALDELNKTRAKSGQAPIAIGIGLHSGPIIAGNIGNNRKLEYTVIGDTVNLASRIEGLTKKHNTSILMSDAVFNKLPSKLVAEWNITELSRSQVVRGKKKRVQLYQVRTSARPSE